MGFLQCVRDDPFTKDIRRTYRANIVTAPRAGIEPLQVAARHNSMVEFRGMVKHLLVDPDSFLPPKVTPEPAAAISGQVSTNVDLNLGAKLTATFLQALGIPSPGASINASIWKGASSYSFEVRDVVSRFVDVNEVGLSLKGRRIDRESPAVGIFYDPNTPVDMMIVTRVLQTPHVLVRAKNQAGSEVEASVDAIEAILGKASAAVSWDRESKGAISFKGKKAVTFGVAAVLCRIKLDRTLNLGLEVRNVRFGSPSSALSETPLFDEDGIILADNQ